MNDARGNENKKKSGKSGKKNSCSPLPGMGQTKRSSEGQRVTAGNQSKVQTKTRKKNMRRIKLSHQEVSMIRKRWIIRGEKAQGDQAFDETTSRAVRETTVGFVWGVQTKETWATIKMAIM